MFTLGDEDSILDDIKEGVEIAMHRKGYGSDSVDPIKFNKLAYFAIKEYDIPITYGWYKYGPAPVNVANQKVSVSPRPADTVQAVNEPRVQSPSDKTRSPEEYSYFFSNDLGEFEHIVETDTKEYLTEFYFEHAPDEYRDLYIASAELQQVLDKVREDPSWHEEGEEVVSLLMKRFPRVIHEVASNPNLKESVGKIQDYEALLTEILTTASDRDDVTEVQQRFIKRVLDYFYGGAWKYVALLISRDTVNLSPGENKDRLLNSIEDELGELRNEYNEEISRLKEEAEKYDLVSESSRVQDVSTEDTRKFDEDFDEEETVSPQEVLEELD
ncbi:MAG: hypothetical protein SV253_01930 [Halobacteria archaeon]|nr:hypothetical protein [Halobacteria archaeon]